MSNPLFLGNPARKRRNPNACEFEHIAGTGVTVIRHAASGAEFLVDTADAASLDWVTWGPNGDGYAQAGGGNRPLLHRVILGYSGPDEVDHINGDRTDNRKANLRVASKLTNQYNRKRWKPGLKGAYVRGSRWVSCIKLPGDKQQTYLGTFDTAEAAHAAYVAAANEHFGEYARAA